ncbi:MBL fold metallo-hydrolase [Aquimarina rhabdastrellae]
MKKIIVALSLFSTFALQAQQKEVVITLQELTPDIQMLTGQGGNIGVFKNEKGLFIIDDQFARLSSKILTKLKPISDQPVTMVVNTHFHGDHTGGNENMSKQGATIFAQKNVRKRMLNNQKQKGQINKSSLPVITFEEGLDLYFENENIVVTHVHNAHTDGDALVYFAQGNVLHMGDTFFNGRYPYVDLRSGGSILGYIKASEKALVLIDDETKIIPGHGKLASKKDLQTFLSMLKTITENVQKEITKGSSEQDIINNTKLTEVYDKKGYGDGFISSERFRKTIYASLTSKK